MDIFSPVQSLADVIVNNWLGITNKYWANAINFFIYDTIKIGLLLVVINYLMAMVRYYLPVGKGARHFGWPQMVRRRLSFGGNAGNDHAVLLLLVNPAVRRVRGGGYSSWRDFCFPYRLALGQRSFAVYISFDFRLENDIFI